MRGKIAICIICIIICSFIFSAFDCNRENGNEVEPEKHIGAIQDFTS